KAETCLGKLTNLRSVCSCPRIMGSHQNSTKQMGGNMSRPRAADDFAAIRARMEELRRERQAAQAPPSELEWDLQRRSTRYGDQPQRETSAAPRPNPAISRDTRLGRDGRC